MLKKLATHPAVIVAAIVGGVILGIWAPAFSSAIGVIGAVYINLLKMVVLPFMISAIVFSLRQLFQMEGFERSIVKVTILFLAAIGLSAVIGAAAGSLAGPGRNLAPDTLVVFGKMVEKSSGTATDYQLPLATPEQTAEGSMLRNIVHQIVPENVFASLVKGDSLKVLVFAILFGVAFGFAPKRIADSLTYTLESIYRACQTLIKWFNLFLPLVLVAMLASQIAETGLDPLVAMTKFVVSFCVVSGLLAVLCAVFLMARAGVGVGKFLGVFRETLLLAIATGSNTACIPNSIESMADGLRFNRPIVELLTPMGAALLRTGPALYYAVAAVFIAQLYDRPFGADQWLMLAIGAFVGGMASAGSSGIVTISFGALTCAYVGLPFEAAFVLFVAVDRVCEIPRTLYNVMSSCLITALVCPRPEPIPAPAP
ncbi:MAG: cation:dicarboxylase symporter family transporter [Sulfuricella sp.]|nr:cation:dicarboxylase symporter family transporter [Sulfuricella sp.]